MKCTKLMLFGGNSDGRAFLWGNPDFPNYRFHSELAEGIPSVEYFPVNAFTVIGNSKINCIIQQYDRQLIFTKNEAYYSYCELRDDGLGNIFSSFPVYSLNGSKGCLVETRGCIIDNRPVTICDDGLNMWEATSVEDEKNAICFSAPITKTFTKLIMGDKTKLDIFDFQSNRELYLLADKIAFVYNYGNGTWYTFNDLAGKYHTAFDSTVYFADDIFLYSYSNGFDTNYQNVFRWKSAFITAGQASGSFDVVGVEADVHIAGDATLKFTLEGNDGKALIERTFKFTENEDKYLRISFRPAIKRLMPFRINIEGRGYGDYTIHGISIKTRQKERSKRIGLL